MPFMVWLCSGPGKNTLMLSLAEAPYYILCPLSYHLANAFPEGLLTSSVQWLRRQSPGIRPDDPRGIYTTDEVERACSV